jgi:hypothetical protein
MAWRETETPINHCIYCGNCNDRASHPDDDSIPSPGDLSVCISCGGITIFTKTLTVRKPSPGELAKIMADPNIGPVLLRMQLAARFHTEENL